jgi:hypothetical protein
LGISGIKFSSTHIDQNKYNHSGVFHNYAIPVKNNLDDGYCSELLELFHMTDVVPWRLADGFSETESSPFLDPPNLFSEINEIELVKGAPQRYIFTTFAKVEKMLNELTPSSINLI